MTVSNLQGGWLYFCSQVKGTVVMYSGYIMVRDAWWQECVVAGHLCLLSMWQLVSCVEHVTTGHLCLACDIWSLVLNVWLSVWQLVTCVERVTARCLCWACHSWSRVERVTAGLLCWACDSSVLVLSVWQLVSCVEHVTAGRSCWSENLQEVDPPWRKWVIVKNMEGEGAWKSKGEMKLTMERRGCWRVSSHWCCRTNREDPAAAEQGSFELVTTGFLVCNN